MTRDIIIVIIIIIIIIIRGGGRSNIHSEDTKLYLVFKTYRTLTEALLIYFKHVRKSDKSDY